MKIGQTVEEELITSFDEDRENQRKAVRENIWKAQTDQKKYYDENRKKPQKYKIGDIVAIRRNQIATTSELNPKFLGPYVIVKCNGHDRYVVQRIGKGNGPKLTSTSADLLKLWQSGLCSLLWCKSGVERWPHIPMSARKSM